MLDTYQGNYVMADPEARQRLMDQVGPSVPNIQAPRAVMAIVLDALYYRALVEPTDTPALQSAALYQELTGRKVGWINVREEKNPLAG